MVPYLLQRVLSMIVTLLFVSAVVFIIIELPPGDFADRYAFHKLAASGQQVTESDMENLRHQFGLDRPPLVRYFDWVGDIILRGDFGTSFLYNVPVREVVGERFFLTFVLAMSSILWQRGKPCIPWAAGTT